MRSNEIKSISQNFCNNLEKKITHTIGLNLSMVKSFEIKNWWTALVTSKDIYSPNISEKKRQEKPSSLGALKGSKPKIASLIPLFIKIKVSESFSK